MPFITLLNQLMSTDNELDLVCVLELVYYFVAEEPTSPSWVLFPWLDVLFRVRPHQIANGSRRGNLYIPLECSDGVDSSAFGGKSSMDAKDLTFNDGSQGQVVESIVEIVPDIVIAVLFGYFIIKAIDVGDVTRLVIASQQNNCLRIFEFV